jgi:predicted  nucleic acid-binding Zn-ribbon protein
MSHFPAGAPKHGGAPDAGAPAGRPESSAASKVSAEVSALVALAELDVRSLASGGRARAVAASGEERGRLVRWLSGEVAESYERALRGGRQPAVVRLSGGVCSGCNVRLHATLEQRIRRTRGAAACPHCLRLVYDPAWLP